MIACYLHPSIMLSLLFIAASDPFGVSNAQAGGYSDLKMIIQWLAASRCGRDVWHFAFGESEASAQLQEVTEAMRQCGFTVGKCVYQVADALAAACWC